MTTTSKTPYDMTEAIVQTLKKQVELYKSNPSNISYLCSIICGLLSKHSLAKFAAVVMSIESEYGKDNFDQVFGNLKFNEFFDKKDEFMKFINELFIICELSSDDDVKEKIFLWSMDDIIDYISSPAIN